MNLNLILVTIVVGGEILLGLHPKTDRITWFLENAPVFFLLPIVLRLHPKLKLTQLTLVILTIHAIVLMIGGHYSYSEVPAGEWVKDLFGFSRNHFDRVGHFLQGFAPAIALRELMLKKSLIKKGVFLSLVVVSMCLAFSAFYELIEWWAALILGQGSDAFLGTQGDPWDTQWDMFMALVGSTIAVLAFGPWQTRLIEKQNA